MKETFTIEEIKEILEKAAESSKMEINESGNVIAVELDKAWNRGVNHMKNSALLEMYGLTEVKA